MTCRELNHVLRSTINRIIAEFGNVYGAKHKIIRALVGSQGTASVNKWLREEDDVVYNFGVKPLARIAASCDYDLHLVFIKRDDDTNKEYIDKLNYSFVHELNELLQKLLQYSSDSDIISSKRDGTVVGKALQNVFAQMGIADILSDNTDGVQQHGSDME